MQSIGVVGTGRLGSCLARAVWAALSGEAIGGRLVALASARLESAQALAHSFGETVLACGPDELPSRAELIFLAVPDARVAELAAGLAVDSRHALVHLSGALPLDVLAPARARGARVGVFHPLQAFAPGAGPDRFHGVHVGVEADEPLATQLAVFAARLGATSFSLHGVDRAAYHAAAVFASNYLVAVQAAAAAVWQRAGLPEQSARAALLPLARGALEAIAQHPLPAALTGPLQRGDVDTLERHLSALAGDPARAALYIALARELLRLPLPLDATRRAELEQLLGADTDEKRRA